MKKGKKLHILIFIIVFFATNIFGNFSNVFSKDNNISPALKISYNDNNSGNLAIIDKQDQEKVGVSSFSVDDGNYYILDPIQKSILIFNGNGYIKSIRLTIQNPLDILVSNNFIYILDNSSNVYKLDLNGKLIDSKVVNSSNLLKATLSKDVNGTVFLGNIRIDDGKELQGPFGFSVAPSNKDKSKFINIISNDKSKNIEIPFNYENGGTRILTSDKYGNVYINVKDIKLGKALDEYDNIIYKISSKGEVMAKYYLPKEIPYTIAYKYVSITSEGDIFYMYPDIDGVKIFKLVQGYNPVLLGLQSVISAIMPIKAKAISRKDVQDRAFKMVDLQWHYIRSRNGNVLPGTTLLPQFAGVEDAMYTGIPYNWGGFDGIDTTSTYKWTNFQDAIENHSAMAGNINTDGGYKSGTAGLDCSGFVQAALNIGGSKLGTWTMKPYLTDIAYTDLKNMDLLLNISEHVTFFVSWQKDVNGAIIGANTIEETGGNADGTGKKAKRYFRDWDDLNGAYTAERANNIDSDFIEDNSASPEIVSPIQGTTLDSDVTFRWNFKDTLESGKQVAYKLGVYSGQIGAFGNLLLEAGEDSGVNEKVIPISRFQPGSYYMSLSTKNDRGYWSAPSLLEFTVKSTITPIDGNTFVKTLSRLGGTDRFQTSLNIASVFDKSKLENVILATGNDFPDALAASTLSKKLNAPIVLIGKTVAGSKMACDYVNNNLTKTGKIYLIGGTGVIDDSFSKYFISSGYSSDNIIRLWGQNRDNTAVVIDRYLNTPVGNPVVIAFDGDFPDALSISSIAGNRQWPILLNDTKSLNSDVAQFLKDKAPSMVYIVGGTGVISDNVKAQVKNILGYGDDKVVRVSGNNRYETSKAINTRFINSTSNVYLTTGEDFPDALSGSALAVISGDPICLVSKTNYSDTVDYIVNSGSSGVNLQVLGGKALFTDDFVSKLIQLCHK